MSKLRVGVVGLRRGKMFVDLFRSLPECEVVAVCDRDERTFPDCGRVAAHTDYRGFLDEGLDLVAVISPGPVHARQSVDAMQAGAHVLCETPCVYSVEDARSVVAANRETGRQFMLAEDYLWSGWVSQLKPRADAGLFGTVVYAEGDYTHDCRDLMLADEDGFVPYAERDAHPHARKTWRATALPPILYTSHTLGPLLHLMNDRIVSAVGMSTGTHTAPELGTIDAEAGLFETEKGAVIRLTNGFTVAHPYALYYNLVGTRGAAKYGAGASDMFVWYSPDGGDAGAWQNAPHEWRARADGRDAVAAMVDDFIGAITDRSDVPLDVHRSLDFVLPGIFAHESALQGSVKLDVPDSRDL